MDRSLYSTLVSFSVCAGVALLLVGGLPARASQPEDCPTWFPDFRCDRSGRYEGFVAPMTSPYLFEDPFITTNISAHGIWHDWPQGSVFGGGDAWIIALQVRVALTDRLALIATKDGYAMADADNPILSDNDGFFDIGAGLKYAIIDRPEDNFILSGSARIDIPVGNDQVFSGNGDGTFIPQASFAWGYGDFHVIADLGGRIPFDRDKESTSLFYNLHLDYAVVPSFVPFFELNGYHWTDSGDGSLKVDTSLGTLTLNQAQAALGTGRFEGADVVNLGSRGVAGHDLVTAAFGVRIPIVEHVTFGAAYEWPITTREDIFNQRVSMNLMLEF